MFIQKTTSSALNSILQQPSYIRGQIRFLWRLWPWSKDSRGEVKQIAEIRRKIIKLEETNSSVSRRLRQPTNNAFWAAAPHIHTTSSVDSVTIYLVLISTQQRAGESTQQHVPLVYLFAVTLKPNLEVRL